ncbi:6883_t:CDS:2 [Funneliformis geosporum]|uniref:13493_t:CDS:1 n=1 Tax=Funneliformis geosporum TaxID=1117311 RepID=A0A9W4WVI8_9GLOM|nr:6883_t:CDS:2 [Funneliformis geosporum]CAI2182165.1 13493_t:CDS:2 [Funneliformis geosporum]
MASLSLYRNNVVANRRKRRFQHLHQRRYNITFYNAVMLRRMRLMGPQNTDNEFATSMLNGGDFGANKKNLLSYTFLLTELNLYMCFTP